MNTKIQNILNDLYAIDPTLKEKEGEVVKLIETLLASRPDAKLDAAFVKALRTKLLGADSFVSSSIPLLTIKTHTFMQKMIYALGGAAIALVIAVPLAMVTVYQEKDPLLSSDEAVDETRSLAFAPEGEHLGSRAFGVLTFQGSSAPREVGEGSQEKMAATTPAGLGGGGGGNAGMAADRMMMPPITDVPVNRYVYRGEGVQWDAQEAEVLKRVKGGRGTREISKVLASFNLGLVDLRGFSDAHVQMFSLLEDKPFGYQISVDAMEGMITIGQNWQKWPSSQCHDQACWDARRVRQGDIPSDQELIRITDAFLKQMGISKASFRAPEVDRSWEMWYAQTEDKANFYFPEQVSVKYPLVVDGKRVFEQYGDPMGMMVSVDIKERRAAGVFNILTQVYSRSAYPAESDTKRIIAIAEKVGLTPWYGSLVKEDGSPVKTVEVGLGTPEEGFMRYWQQNDTISNELLVPSLIFPVMMDAPGGYTGSRFIVVPRVLDILDELERNNQGMGGGGPIRIMPMDESVPTPVQEPIMKGQ